MNLPITTKNLSIREFFADDAESMWALENDPEFKRYLGGITGKSVEEYKAVIRKGQFRMTSIYAVMENVSRQFIGYCHLGPCVEEDEGAFEFWCMIAPNHHRKGFGTEVIVGLISNGFDVLEAVSLYAKTKNPIAKKINQRIGMEVVREIGDEEVFVMTRDKYLETKDYLALLK